MQINKPEIDALAETLAGILSIPKPVGRWLTLAEAMAYAKVKSPTTLKKWINEGLIYGFKRSGEWIVDRKSIDAWYSSDRDY